jgi:glycosyltransferase involved in cell wall biosynthesis
MKNKKYQGVCIVSYPLSKAFTTPISNLSEIISKITNVNLIIGSYENINISENKFLTIHMLQYTTGLSKHKQAFRYFRLNLQVMLKLFSLRNSYNQVIFFMESCPLLPMLFSFLFRKRIYWMLPSKISYSKKDLHSKIENFLSKIGCHLTTKIVLYSYKILTDWKLESQQKKTLIAHEHFLDFSNFYIQKPFSNRSNLIGYIGRLSAEKGIQNFVEALPIIIDRYQDLKIIIGGDGPLKNDVKNSLEKQNISDHVTIYSWIAHDSLPNYFNKLRLIVLPSYTEGLPNIMLEAMACGTPVLATAVGAIPDVIRDGETGFIMENNSPGCIANNIIRALNHPHLEKISENARKLVEHEFTFEKAVERFRKIIDEF